MKDELDELRSAEAETKQWVPPFWRVAAPLFTGREPILADGELSFTEKGQRAA